MAKVTIDMEEYDLLRNHTKEVEEQVKKLKEENDKLRDSSYVIVRTIERTSRVSVFGVSDSYETPSEEFVNFDDIREEVKSKINQEEKDKLNDAISAYNQKNEEYIEKFKNIEKKFNKKLEEKQESFNREASNTFRNLNAIRDKLMSISQSLENKFVRHGNEIREINDIIENIKAHNHTDGWWNETF